MSGERKELMEKATPMENMKMEDIVRKMATDMKDDLGNMGHVNIIIAGKTGTGKSTLINTAFRAHLAKTGMGRPVTQELRLIEKDDIPLRIYDTVGLELNEERKKASINEIRELIEEKINKGEKDEFIHCMWYCVQADSDRLEDAEQEYITEIAEKIPVVLVITKSYLKKHAREFASIIEHYNLPVKAICPILAEPYEDDDFKAGAYGVDILVEKTMNLLPESAQRAWVNAEAASLKIKQEKAESIVKQTVAVAFGTGYSPIPFSDAALLVPTQLSMIARITNVYGLSMTKRMMSGILYSLLGTAGATFAGRTVVSNLLKLIPGVGTIAGGAISGGTAAALTYALGKTYIQIVEWLYAGEMKEDDLETEAARDKIKDILLENLKKNTGID